VRRTHASCKIGPNSTQIAFCCGNVGVETISQEKNRKKVVNARKSMVLEIFQLSISDETHLKRLKRLEIYWMEIPVSWSFCLHSRSYFQGNFQTLKVERGVRFPKEFPEIYVKANI
jgi:hypothetical protein